MFLHVCMRGCACADVRAPASNGTKTVRACVRACNYACVRMFVRVYVCACVTMRAASIADHSKVLPAMTW